MPASPQQRRPVPQGPVRRGPGRGTVTCPAGQIAVIVSIAAGGGRASFRPWCGACPLRSACTASRRGRTIAIHPHEAVLQRARAAQRDPAWQQRYRTVRPTVERKISHFTRRAWGGRQARTRGLTRVTTDLVTRAGALNCEGLDYDSFSNCAFVRMVSHAAVVEPADEPPDSFLARAPELSWPFAPLLGEAAADAWSHIPSIVITGVCRQNARRRIGWRVVVVFVTLMLRHV